MNGGCINNYWKVILVTFYCYFSNGILIATRIRKGYWESVCLQKDSEELICTDCYKIPCMEIYIAL